MNKKGFTLVELLAVIILLGVMALIATITISNEIRENKQALYDIQISNIKEAARTWASMNAFRLPSTNGESFTITLSDIKEAGLGKEYVNPKTKEEFPNDLQIKITLVENNYVYEIVE